MKTEPELDRRRPSAVGLRIDGRHDGVDVFVSVVVDAPQRPKVDGIGTGDAGGVQSG